MARSALRYESLRRPDSERAYLLIPIGYPKNDCTVSNLEKKGIVGRVDRDVTEASKDEGHEGKIDTLRPDSLG
jgi:hypothetical protein